MDRRVTHLLPSRLQQAIAGLAKGGSPKRPSPSQSRTKGSPRKRSAPLAPPPPPPPPPPAAAAAAGPSAVDDENWWPDGPGVEFVVEEERPRVKISTNHLMFPMTALGIPRDATMQLTNLEKEPVHWNIFGYSVPYLVKVRGGRGRPLVGTAAGL